jgi:ribonuclease HII
MVVFPSFKHERALMAEGFSLFAGVDEVGCGCFAGPVYAAAVILPFNSRLGLIRDSKTLSKKQRDGLAIKIRERATAWAVGSASVQEIDNLNIRQAAFLAMRRAIESLTIQPQIILSDGFMIPGLSIPCRRIIKGDRYVKSIAAASIIAKVDRDKEMDRLDGEYPKYGFAKHKGYGTKMHQNALKQYGATPIHRMSFAPLKGLAPMIYRG